MNPPLPQGSHDQWRTFRVFFSFSLRTDPLLISDYVSEGSKARSRGTGRGVPLIISPLIYFTTGLIKKKRALRDISGVGYARADAAGTETKKLNAFLLILEHASNKGRRGVPSHALQRSLFCIMLRQADVNRTCVFRFIPFFLLQC